MPTLDAGWQAIRDMKDLDGKTPLNLTSKFLPVGSADETLVEQIMTEITATTATDANPLSGRLDNARPRVPGCFGFRLRRRRMVGQLP